MKHILNFLMGLALILMCNCKTAQKTTKPEANNSKQLKQESSVPMTTMPTNVDSLVRVYKVAYKIYFSDHAQKNKIEMLDNRDNLGKYDYPPLDTTIYKNRLFIQSTGNNHSFQYEINHPLYQPRSSYKDGKILKIFELTTYKEFIITIPYLSDNQNIRISEIINNKAPILLLDTYQNASSDFPSSNK